MFRAFRGFHSSCTKKGLRVAFFGSDHFSIPSFKALANLSKSNPEIIESIDLIAKYPKHTGRDLKTVSDVPIAEIAKAEGINIIRAEANKEILDLIPRNYSLAIAVSYGKLIPKEFIEKIPYSLNLHPSLLPKYSGASPLQYALLNQDEFTGVTIQTLHPTLFDKGQIVDQTDEIKIEKFENLASLTNRLAIIGSDLLIKVLINNSFKNPNFKSTYDYSYAKKITPSMKQINWDSNSDEILAKFNALGPLFSYKEIKVKQRRKPLIHEFRRIIFNDIEISDLNPKLNPGEFALTDNGLLIKTKNGSILSKNLQFEFQKKEDFKTFFNNLHKRSGETTKAFTNK